MAREIQGVIRLAPKPLTHLGAELAEFGVLIKKLSFCSHTASPAGASHIAK